VEAAKTLNAPRRRAPHVRPFVVLLLLAGTVLLPGCARDRVNPYEAPLEPGVGHVLVTVATAGGRDRVAEAMVLAQPWGAYGITDKEGNVLLAGLAPGNGTLTANKEGYFDRQVNVQVVAGVRGEAVLILDRQR
jgi:hypothetical protein